MDASADVGVGVTAAVGVGVGVVFGIEIAVGEGTGTGVFSSTHPANTTTAAIIDMAIKSLLRGSYRFMQCSQLPMIFKPDQSCFPSLSGSSANTNRKLVGLSSSARCCPTPHFHVRLHQPLSPLTQCIQAKDRIIF